MADTGPGGRRCDGCLAWQRSPRQDLPLADAGEIGQCRLRAPACSTLEDGGTWPRTWASYWCLEYRPADSEQTVPVGEKKIVINPPPRPKTLHDLAKDWDGKVRS